jgi:predicted porin
MRNTSKSSLSALAVAATLWAAPACADLKLELQGYFRGYAVYTDNDTSAAQGPNKLSSFEFMRRDDMVIAGETTLDNGLTIGVHNDIALGNEAVPTGGANYGSQEHNLLNQPGTDPTMTYETYGYMQGGWGRFNLGADDGAAFLLQVAAPAADSNIDGMRVYIQGFDVSTWTSLNPGTATLGANAGVTVPLDYQNADFRASERLTYLTPRWNGFQAGISYAAVPGMQNTFGGAYGQPALTAGHFRDPWEAAARWDGMFEGTAISLGAGYASATTTGTVAAGGFASRDIQTWDGGVNLTWGEFSLGGAYKWSNTGVSSALAAGNADVSVWDAGLGWDYGPWHAGASYFDENLDPNAYALGLPANLKLHRETLGGGYIFGPGMSLRSTLSLLQADDEATGARHPGQTQITAGTDINF